MWDPGRAFLLIISAVNICVGQLSIKNSLLAERKDWIEPSSRFENTAIDEIRTEEARQHEQADELTPDRHAILDSGSKKCSKLLGTCEQSLSKCEAQLLRYQMLADATNNGKLSTDMVYLRKWVKNIMTRLEGGYLDQKDTPGRLELAFSTEDIEELRILLNKLDARSASRISIKMNDIVTNAEVFFDYRERPSKVQLFWLSVIGLLSEVNLLVVIRVTILLLGVLFIVIILISRSRVVTYGYSLFFLFWLSYFWYWQNLLRHSEADLYLLNQKSPCEDGRAWYNPSRYVSSDSKECQEYMRRQFTPAHMEYSPIEVLLRMVSEYSSKAISLGIANLLSGLGVAIREFADQQSWFSVVPAFILLFGVLVILAFKASGMSLSFFGLRMEASGKRGTQHFEPIVMQRGNYIHEMSEQFDLDESRGGFPESRMRSQYVKDLHAAQLSRNTLQQYRLSSMPATLRLIEMPPPSDTTVLKRARQDRVRPSQRLPVNRARSDCSPSKHDDEDQYDTANDDNDS